MISEDRKHYRQQHKINAPDAVGGTRKDLTVGKRPPKGADGKIESAIKYGMSQ